MVAEMLLQYVKHFTSNLKGLPRNSIYLRLSLLAKEESPILSNEGGKTIFTIPSDKFGPNALFFKFLQWPKSLLLICLTWEWIMVLSTSRFEIKIVPNARLSFSLSVAIQLPYST